MTDQFYASVVTTALYVTLVLENWYQNAVSPLLRHSLTFRRSVVQLYTVLVNVFIYFRVIVKYFVFIHNLLKHDEL